MKKKITFILQPKVQHYRLHIFDKLIIKLEKSHKILVFGITDNGEAINGGKRDYILNLKYKALFGLEWWSGLINKLLKYKPSIVVQTASPRNFSCWFLLSFSKFFGIKLIGWSKINSDRDNESFLKKHIKRFFYSRYADLILYGDKSLQEIEKLKITNVKTYLAYNTIDTDFVKNKKEFLDIHKKKIISKFKLDKINFIYLCIGRMIDEKRQGDIIDAWKISSIDKNVSRLIFVGSGPNYKNLKNKNSYLDKSIIFVGRVPTGIDYVWLCISHFSVFGGALGLGCQQSFLMRSLVIAPYENNVDSEFLINKQNSILFEKGNIFELSKIIEIVCKNNNNDILDNAFNYVTNHRHNDKLVGEVVRAITS
ncbi:hypothetical protein N9O69_03105 [Alphaproteobacteria bacterium]|nr:hypothetical protein [Alphaproteobacteria bacterium]